MTKDEIIYFIKQCDREIKEHTDTIDAKKRSKNSLFKSLSSQCKNRDQDGAHCRHESLKRIAKSLGCNAYANGCCIPVCPLIK